MLRVDGKASLGTQVAVLACVLLVLAASAAFLTWTWRLGGPELACRLSFVRGVPAFGGVGARPRRPHEWGWEGQVSTDFPEDGPAKTHAILSLVRGDRQYGSVEIVHGAPGAQVQCATEVPVRLKLRLPSGEVVKRRLHTGELFEVDYDQGSMLE